MWVAVSITAALLATAIFIVLRNGYDEGTKKWAFNTISFIAGFWMRPTGTK
jgi:hypothetical protein